MVQGGVGVVGGWGATATCCDSCELAGGRSGWGGIWGGARGLEFFLLRLLLPRSSSLNPFLMGYLSGSISINYARLIIGAKVYQNWEQMTSGPLPNQTRALGPEAG